MSDPAEIKARSDAAFDGRDFDALGASDKRRYLERSAAAIAALRGAGWAIVPKTASDQMAASGAAALRNRIMPIPEYDFSRPVDLEKPEPDNRLFNRAQMDEVWDAMVQAAEGNN